MKLSSIRISRLIGTATLATFCLLAVPQLAEAKGPQKKGKYFKSQKSSQTSYYRGRGDDRGRAYYTSRPRSTFVLSFGTGYAGRGYYYGPPNSPYYYQHSDVRYYSTREAAPRHYYNSGGYGTGASVQQALARQGYYHGRIDGAIGPQSRRSIANYQRDRGLRPTGAIDSSLLRSLGLR